MDLLEVVRDLGLPNWAIGAGFVRAAVWDAMADHAVPTPLDDIDVLYVAPRRLLPGRDAALEARLMKARPGVNWSVRNEARMHAHNGERPYRGLVQAIAHWIETPTCVAVRLEADGTLTLIAPHGLADLARLRTRPTPAAKRRMAVYRERLIRKSWRRSWPGLTVRLV